MNAESGRNIGIIDPRHTGRPSFRVGQDRFQERHRTKPHTEQGQLSGLAQEVDLIKKRGESDLYLLPDTGFQVKTQIDLLLQNYKHGISLSDSFSQLEQDVQGFKTEYLVEQPVFPIVLEKAEHEGRMRLVGKLYGGKPIVDATDEKERGGVVKKSIQHIEERLLDAPPGFMAVMTSPKGWSGYDGITYPDSQTYCFQVQKDGSIAGFTLKTDMDLSQNEELLKSLGVENDAFQAKADSQTAIKRVVENVAFIDPENDKSIVDIAHVIQHIKKSNVAYKDSSGKSRTFVEMAQLLKNPEPLWTLDYTTQRLVDEFKDYGTQRIGEADSQRAIDLQVALGYSILKLMHEVRPPKGRSMSPGNEYVVAAPVVFNARDTLNTLQEIGGCAGGGKKKDTISSITPRLVQKFGETDDSQEWFNCPKCKYQADGPIGDTCPGCNLTKDEYAAEEGAVVCD